MSATLDRDTRPATRPARFLEQLEIARRGFRIYLLGLSGGGAIAAAGTVGAVLLLLDAWLILPVASRAIGLVLLAAAGVAMLVKPLGRLLRLRTGDAATAIERAFPEMGQRLTTSLDYVHATDNVSPARPALIDALVVDTDTRTQRLDLDRLVPWGRLALVASVLFLGLLVGMVSLGVSRDLRIAALRLLLVPVHYSRLEIKPGTTSVKEGEDFKIDVTVQGRAVPQLELRHRPRGQTKWTAVSLIAVPPVEEGAEPLPPEPVLGTVSTTLRKPLKDLEYQVVSGEIVSPTYQVRVLHPLVLKKASAKILPPAYTKRKPSEVPQGSLKVIEGSHVRLEFAFDVPPARVRLETTRKTEKGPASDSQVIPVNGLKSPGNTLAFNWANVSSDVDYQMFAESIDGLALESPRYRLRVQKDEKPTVKFVDPPEQLEVTPTTEVPLIVSTGDDFGVGKVGVVVQVADGPKEMLLLEDFPESRPTAEAIARLFLEKHDVTFTDAVTYHAFVEDNRPSPQRVTTDLRFIDVRPYQREYQMKSGSGTCQGGCSTSLEELIARQRLNLNRTFALQDENTVNDETLKRLVRNQEELHTVTKEFADGLASQFEAVPPLEEAVVAMQQALERLKARTMPRAVESEEQAVKSLVRARQNLRKLLKEQSPSQCEACQKYDQQQQQKLRPPPRKKEDQQAQLGDDVQKLAKRQKKFSEDLASKPSSVKLDPLDPSQPPQAQQKKSSSAQSQSQSSSQSQAKPAGDKTGEPESEDLVKKQQDAAQQAADLQKRVAQDESLTDLARQRMEASAKQIQKSAESLKAGDKQAAEEAARNAADQLEQLAQQIAGLKTPDLSARIGKARDLAQQLAEKQGALGRQIQSEKPSGPSARGQKAGGDEEGEKSADPSSSAGQSTGQGAGDKPEELSSQQRRLAAQAKTLADLLNRLKSDAAEENRDLSQSLSQAMNRHSPETTSEQMEQAASQLEQGDRPGAARDATAAARELADLARDLDSAHRGLVRDLLDQLLAAEKQAAATEQKLSAMKSTSDKAAAQAEMSRLQETLERLSQPGQAVNEAAGQLATAAGENWKDDRDPRGNYVVPQASLNGVKRTVQALQARIQELILKDAALDRDSNVPPEYRTLVEEYYKALSEDLR